jgi:four helix bundle protein
MRKFADCDRSQKSEIRNQKAEVRKRLLIAWRIELRDFREPKVWGKSHQLALQIHKATAHFPKEEMYGLTSQIRRASASIPANIAEGCGRSGVAELSRFLNISMGSASELEYHLMLASDLGFLELEAYRRLSTQTVEVKRMLGSYIEKINADRRNQILAKDE